MSKLRQLGGTVAIAAAVVTAGGTALAGSPESGPHGAVPADNVTITDPSGQISIAVPPSWTDTVSVDDGHAIVIGAAPNFATFLAGHGPGVRVVSSTVVSDDTAASVAAADLLGDDCAVVSPPAPWAHPTMPGGSIASWVCGELTRHDAYVNAPDNSRSFSLSAVVSPVEPVDPNTILASLAYAPGVPAEPEAPIPPTTAPAPPTPEPPAPERADPEVAPAEGTGETFPNTASAPLHLTVLDAGDPATAVALNAPFPVGASASSHSTWTESGTETITEGALTDSATYEFHQEAFGTETVVAANPDGTFTMEYTQASATVSSTHSNPQYAWTLPDPTVVDGLPVQIHYDAQRRSTGIQAPLGTSPTPAQIDWYSDSHYYMTQPVPDTPVGVGATWTWTTTTTFWGVDVPVTGMSTLYWIEGDQYAVTTTTTTDLGGATVQPTGVASMTGGFTEQITSTGSISNPLLYRQDTQSTNSYTITYTDGSTYTLQSTGTGLYTETPF